MEAHHQNQHTHPAHAHPAHHGHDGHHHHHHTPPNNWRLAFSATLHCLIGCGIGEVVGMSISMALGWAVWPSIALSVSLGFVFGLLLGVRPWLREGYGWAQALKAVLIAEGLSIVVMEAAEVTAQLTIPGLREAHLTSGLFWGGMLLSLAAGFAAAYPINLWLVRRGVTHKH